MSYQIQTKNIVLSALMLSFLVVSSIISHFLIPLPNGLGSWFVLTELLIIFYSFKFGVKKTLLVTSLLYCVIAWIWPFVFIDGVFYVKNIENIIGVYFLDYILPVGLLSISGLTKKLKHSMIYICLIIISNYGLHVISGVIFWGSYAWVGYSVWLYALIANSIRSSICLVLTIFCLPLLLKRNIYTYETKIKNKR